MSTNLLDLLADPVRVAIVRALADRQPASLEEIASAAKVHHNTARAHIAELEERGAVSRRHGQTGRPGRPQVLYRLHDEWVLPSSDMRGLAELLAALALRLHPSADELDDLGRQWGRYLAGRPGADDLDSLPRELERFGFDTRLEATELHVGGCPCPIVAPHDPAVICTMMKAVVDGLAEATTERLRVISSAHDPDRRSCTITLGERRPRGARTRTRTTHLSTATKGRSA
jgi:predicted ArsR family transcriptional regulator